MKRETAKNKDYRRSKKKEKLEDKEKKTFISHPTTNCIITNFPNKFSQSNNLGAAVGVVAVAALDAWGVVTGVFAICGAGVGT